MELLAIDIGGTGIKLGLVNQQGVVSFTSQIKTPRENYQSLPTLLMKEIDKTYEGKFTGIAISATGLSNLEKRTIGEGGPMYEAFGKTLLADLKNRYQCETIGENDGNCAVIAEAWLGNGQGYDNIVSVVLGTSVGGAIFKDGKIYPGSHRLAGEFGYFLIAGKDKPWEIWSIEGSTKGLIQKVAAEKGIPFETITGYEVVEAYEHKDPQVVPHVERFCELLAVQCYNLQYAYDPEIILIGGGISSADFLLPKVEEKLNELKEMIPSTVILPKIQRCKFGNESNLIGAAKLWFDYYGK